jgi:RNA-directed DNA polymerase
MDIRDFFESINEASVYRVFRSAGYQPLPAFELARVCTRYAGHVARLGGTHYGAPENYRVIRAYRRPHLGFLPQGAATSGALANQVSMRLDLKLAAMARSFNLVYTRYADDMTFSSSGDFDRPTSVRIVNIAAGIIRRNGFVPHDQKTIIAPPGARKLVLGLLVDGSEVRLSGKMRSRILNHLRGVEEFGIPQHADHMKFSSEDGLVRHVTGLLAYAVDIERPWAETLIERWGDVTRRGGWAQLPRFHDR